MTKAGLTGRAYGRNPALLSHSAATAPTGRSMGITVGWLALTR
jgi:hypothetical protein